jgi:predicted transglutaminase-like cysteine proteinase
MLKGPGIKPSRRASRAFFTLVATLFQMSSVTAQTASGNSGARPTAADAASDLLFRPPLRGSLDADGLMTSSIAAPLSAALRADDGVFNTVTIPASHLAISQRWREILADDPARIFTEGCEASPATCQSAVVRAFLKLDAENEASPLTRLVLARKVNLAVNHTVRYQLDSVTYGVEDYWATPAESASRGVGDCEDFAILKMGMLAAFGLPLSSMQVVVVKDLKRNAGHAILNIRLGGTNYILDNLTDMVRSDDLVTNYHPFYSVSANGSWLHGVRSPGAQPAQQADAKPLAMKTDIMSLDPAALMRGTLGRFDPSVGRR